MIAKNMYMMTNDSYLQEIILLLKNNLYLMTLENKNFKCFVILTITFNFQSKYSNTSCSSFYVLYFAYNNKI